MANTAFQVQYRQEFIEAFEQGESLVRMTVTTDAEIRAQQAVFLVAGSGGATAVTRGVNGLIPARADDLNQYTATLTEWHDLVRRTGYNLYASQGDGRRIMQMSTRKVLNRKIDADIINTLSAGVTQHTGNAATASVGMVNWALAILGNNAVPLDGNVSALITPGFYGYIQQAKEFSNIQWIENKPFSNRLTMFRWNNVNWIVHPNLPNKGTSSEQCFMYHKDAIGHACDMENLQVDADYMREQDYSWARASTYMGSKVLQVTGIVQMTHDGSGFAAT